jgi:hypothetical protein
MSVEENKKTVETLCQAPSEMDWATLMGCLTSNVSYEDVATEDGGAHDPENVVN